MRIAYVKTSISEKDRDYQIKTLEKFNIEKWFEEIAGCDDLTSTKLSEMIDFAKHGDLIYVTDLNKLGRTTTELITTLERINKKNLIIVSIKENIDSSTSEGRAKISMVQAMVDFEKNSFSERRLEGIENAKREGKCIGRQPIKINKKHFDKIYNDYMSRKLTKIQFAEKVGITRPTLDKFIKAYETDSLGQTEDSYFVDSNK